MNCADGLHENACAAAIAIAGSSQHQFRVGAVIAKGKRIISLACNSSKTTPFIRNKVCNKTLVDRLHAEMSCILKAHRDVRGTKIYIARLKLSAGVLGMAFPCDLCMSMIKEAGIKEVFYTDDNGNWASQKIGAII